MIERKKPFTLEDGIEVQREHLAEWRTKLSAACFEDLKRYALNHNCALSTKSHDGFDVVRGQGLTQFVCNWKP